MSSKCKASLDVNIHLTLSQLFLNCVNRGNRAVKLPATLKFLIPQVTNMLHWQARQSEHPLLPTKRSGHPPKLDAQARRAITRHVEKYTD